MDKTSLINIIEGRILAERRKHPALDWIHLASIKIANDIVNRDENLKPQSSGKSEDKFKHIKPLEDKTKHLNTKESDNSSSKKDCCTCKGLGYYIDYFDSKIKHYCEDCNGTGSPS